jgi:hypothetical protein
MQYSPMGRTLIADLNPNGRFLNPGAHIIGSSVRANQAQPQPEQQQETQQDQVPWGDIGQASQNAQADYERDRILFGKDGADLVNLDTLGLRMTPKDKSTGLPKYGHGTPRTPARAFVVGDKTKANPTGEEVVITSGPSMVIPKTAFTKGKAFGNLPPKRDGKTGFPKFGNGGMTNVTPEEDKAPSEWKPSTRDSAGSGAIPGLSPGQALVQRQMEAKAAGLPMPRENALPFDPILAAAQEQAKTPAPPTPTGSRSAFAPPSAPAPKWGSSLARNYKPIGHDYDPGGNMEQTETGSFRHPLKMRRTDERRFLRSPRGTAFAFQQAATDSRYDRMDSARREERMLQRQDQEQDREYSRNEGDRIYQRMREAELEDTKDQRAYSRREREETEKDRAIREAADRDRDAEDFFSFSDVPGSPGYQMNRRGQSFRKGADEPPLPAEEDMQKRGLRATGYDQYGRPTGWEQPASKPTKFTVWKSGQRYELDGNPEDYDLTDYETGPPRKSATPPPPAIKDVIGRLNK